MTIQSCCVRGCSCAECKAILAPIAEHLQYQQKVLARIEESLAKLQVAAPKPAITQAEAVKYVAMACRAENLPAASAFSRRTLLRMEAGEVSARLGYSAAVRQDKTIFLAWLRNYIADEKFRRQVRHSERYSEGSLEHNS